MPANTPKHAIPYILGSDIGNTIDDTDKAQAERVDALLTPFDQGDLSARPVSTAASPGKAGRIFRATDGANAGRVFIDHGTGWTEVGALLGALLVMGAITIADGNYTLDAVAPGNLRLSSAGEVLIRVAGVEVAGLGASLRSTQDHVAREATAQQARIGTVSGLPGLALGNPLDAFLFRIAAARMGVGSLNVGAVPGSSNGIPVSAGVEELRTIRGTVNVDGTIAAGAGFTVAYTGSAYRITFSTAFAATPSVMTVHTTGTRGETSPWNANTASVDVYTWDSSGVGGQKGPFAFVAEGPR